MRQNTQAHLFHREISLINKEIANLHLGMLKQLMIHRKMQCVSNVKKITETFRAKTGTMKLKTFIKDMVSKSGHKKCNFAFT